MLIFCCLDVVMTILVLVRNFVPAHEQVARGDWDVAAGMGDFPKDSPCIGYILTSIQWPRMSTIWREKSSVPSLSVVLVNEFYVD